MSRKNRSERRRRRAGESIPVDVRERPDEFVVTADLPGIRKQDIDVRVKKNRVQILVDAEDFEATGPFARRVREHEQISRVVELPDWVNEKQTDADYTNGRLRIRLPKRRRRRSVDIE